MEFLGTFYVAIAVSLTSNPIAIGLMLMAMICVGSALGVMHYNGALTLSFLLTNHISLRDAVGYWAAQIAGSFVALYVFYVITNMVYAPEPMIDMPLWLSMNVELMMIIPFCLVALFLCLRHSKHVYTPVVQAITIGFSFMAIAFVGGIFNPSIASASLLWHMMYGGEFYHLNNLVIYVVGPLIGACLAGVLHKCIHEDKSVQHGM